MFVLDPFGDQKIFQDFGTISDTRNVTLVWSISRIGLPYKIDTAIYIYIYETCAWTPNNVFLSMIVVESLSR